MRVLITGGAGFIGSNLAEHFLRNGHQVRILDDLSRPGTESNLHHLRSVAGELEFLNADIRDYEKCEMAVSDVRSRLSSGSSGCRDDIGNSPKTRL